VRRQGQKENVHVSLDRNRPEGVGWKKTEQFLVFFSMGNSRNVGYLWVYGYLSWLMMVNNGRIYLVGGLEHGFYDVPFSWEWNVIIPTDFH